MTIWGSFNLLELACSGFPGGSDGKGSACSARDPVPVCETGLQCTRPGSIPGSGRSPGEGNGNPLENSMDGGAL